LPRTGLALLPQPHFFSHLSLSYFITMLSMLLFKICNQVEMTKEEEYT
jgi:hypothetical protein